ncbi:7700_t:CDS:10 [Acaulospora morrowiae]|uniref:Carboxypeptidase n=1 Tax=Acaulospora morrowiae TaxID=94023 RepID=A0A9N8V9G4_9GLOM|nr:7700_t:CDS:10 [Acaulospora morrowiae]
MVNYYKSLGNLFALLFILTGVTSFPAGRRATPPASVYNIVSSNLCNPSVKQYSGYIQINSNSYLFFWFFEALSNPLSSPLTLWLNGGPGCSSMDGLFTEIGPCYTNSDGSNTRIDSDSWISYSNILFIDQPVGTGFSYTTGTYAVNSTEQSMGDLYVFLQLFFEKFPEYSKLDFHIFGESYAGHYIPTIAKKIVDSNTLINSNKSQGIIINLKSIGMGNSINGKLLDDTHIKRMKGALVECEQALTLCNQTNSTRDCYNAEIICIQYENYFDFSGKSVYDIRVSESATDDLLNPPFQNYLRRPDVIKSIGALSSIKFQLCNDNVQTRFINSGDLTIATKPQTEFLLKNGIRVLIYNGDADYIVNWFGGNKSASAIQWSHQSEFNMVPLTEWCGDVGKAGQVRSFDALWFVRVYQSGHMVPYFQPKNSLIMYSNWINNQSLLSNECHNSPSAHSSASRPSSAA